MERHCISIICDFRDGRARKAADLHMPRQLKRQLSMMEESNVECAHGKWNQVNFNIDAILKQSEEIYSKVIVHGSGEEDKWTSDSRTGL